MDMPKPGPEHRQIAKLVGNWVGEEKLSPSPFDPKGGMAKARVHNKLDLDGFIVVQDYEQTRDGAVSFRGHGVFAWDPVKKCVALSWFDSMGGVPQTFLGNFQGDVLAMTSDHPMGKARCTFDVSGGTYKFSLDMSEDGKQWMQFMAGAYKRG